MKTQKLYSDGYCDSVTINEELYNEFMESIKKSNKYDESKLNDLIYFAFETSKELNYKISKKRLLLKIADIVDVIPIERLTELKAFELEPLLKAEKDYYLIVLNEIESDNMGGNLPILDN